MTTKKVHPETKLLRVNTSAAELFKMKLWFMLRYSHQLRRERHFLDRLDLFASSDSELIRHYPFPLCELLRLMEFKITRRVFDSASVG